MKKKFGLLCIVLAAVMAFAACGGSDTGNGGGGGSGRPAGTKIIIYAGGSSEFSWVKGTEEAAVIEYIEQKYYEDTHNSIDFQIAYLGEDMRTKLASEIAAGGQVDIAISHTRGEGSGIDEWAIENDMFYDIADVLYDYAPNLYDAVEGTPLDSLTNSNNQTVGIPSVINPYKFGILVRKDLMERCGYTDDSEKAASGDYELVDNIETFEEMCKAMNGITGNSYAVTGAIWDIEKTFVGAYANAGYFTKGYVDTNNDGTPDSILMGGAAPAFGDMLALQSRWASTGIISVEANSILLDQAEANFISGRTGVFIEDPTIQHLIEVARKTKAANADAEFTVLGALRAKKSDDPATAKKGFMRNPYATFGAVLLKNTTKARDIMRFLNWVYKNEDNYNLCRYGIEGTHWVNNGDGTYSFPEGKSEYLTRKPYSGILTLVENQNMSNLTYDGYTAEEKHWITDIAGDKNNYVENEVVDYIFTNTRAMQTTYETAFTKLHTSAKQCWAGLEDPLAMDVNGKAKFTNWSATYIADMATVTQMWTNEFLLMKAARAARG